MLKTIQLTQIKATRPRGLVIYEGPSMIDGEAIVAIATGFFHKTENPKTGPGTIQTWILRRDMDPVEAVETGEDESICSQCRHRGTSCYVHVSFGPKSIYDAYKRGIYIKAKPEHLEWFNDRFVRLGSYGDPIAISWKLWDTILGVTKGHSGYTHSWLRADARFKNILMASADTPEELYKARSLGWRTFRTRLPEEPPLEREFICPASNEAGHKTDCATCGCCNGGEYKINSGRRTPVIIAHGNPINLVQYRKARGAFVPKKKREMLAVETTIR